MCRTPKGLYSVYLFPHLLERAVAWKLWLEPADFGIEILAMWEYGSAILPISVRLIWRLWRWDSK